MDALVHQRLELAECGECGRVRCGAAHGGPDSQGSRPGLSVPRGSNRALTARMIGAASPIWSPRAKPRFAGRAAQPAARRCRAGPSPRGAVRRRSPRGCAGSPSSRTKITPRAARPAAAYSIPCSAVSVSTRDSISATSVGSDRQFRRPFRRRPPSRRSCALQASASACPVRTSVAAPCVAHRRRRGGDLPLGGARRCFEANEQPVGRRLELDRRRRQRRTGDGERQRAERSARRQPRRRACDDAGGSGASLNVALVITARLPSDPHSSFDRS